MPTTRLADDVLEVRLSRREKIAGLLRDLRVPLSSITDVDVVPDGLAATTGIRAPGLALPGLTHYGTWRRRGRKQFVAVRRNAPTLRLQLRDHRFDAALVSLDDAHEVAERLRR